MEQQQNQPIHRDTPRGGINVTLFVALVVAVIGLVLWLSGRDPLLLILGAAYSGYTWFTSPKQFLIYDNALVIAYGRPRVKVFPFPEISDIEMLVLPMGNRLRVRMVNGRRVTVAAKNIDEFRDRLDEARGKFNGPYESPQLPDESTEDSAPY